jgi:hypothetical protein
LSTIPGQYDILAPQGATFSETYTYKLNGSPVDLTSYTARMQVRRTPSTDTKTLDLTTENGAIVLGGALGTIAVTVSATAMAAVSSGKYRYDLEVVSSGGVVTRLLEGVFVVSPEVTR